MNPKFMNKHNVRDQISHLTIDYNATITYLDDSRDKKREYGKKMTSLYKVIKNTNEGTYNPEYVQLKELYLDEKERVKYYEGQLKHMKKELRRLNTVLNKIANYI